MVGLMTDDIVQRIERFRLPRGAAVPERRNRGYTLYHALSGAPVARLRPTGRNDSVEILYWSAWSAGLPHSPSHPPPASRPRSAPSPPPTSAAAAPARSAPQPGESPS